MSYNTLVVADDEPVILPHNNQKRRLKWCVGISIIVLCVAIVTIVVMVSRDHTPDDSEPFASLTGYCDDVPPIPLEEYATRRSKMSQELTNTNYDAFITEPGASMTYFSNVSWSLSERAFLLVIFANGSVAFLSPKFEEARAEERVGDLGPIFTWEEYQNPYQVLFENLFAGAQNLVLIFDPETRAFIPEGMRNAAVPFGHSIQNGYDAVRAVRMIKSDNEIAILRCINKATKAALHVVHGMIKADMTEDELGNLMLSAVAATGLTPEFVICLFAANAAYPHGTDQRLPLKSGDLILIDTGGSLYGYQSDITRTFPFDINHITDFQRLVWNVTKEAQNAALAAIIPNVKANGDLDAAARNVVGDHGFGYEYGNFTHRLGHGIGLQGHEEPYNVQGNTLTLRPGMVFSVEPGIYLPGILGVRHEDIVLVTADGYEVFGPLTESIENPVPPVTP